MTLDLAPVDRALRLLDAFGVELLDRVGGARDESLCVVLRLEVGEDVVRERARIASLRAADPDAQAQEVRRLQVLRDRAQAVVPESPPPTFSSSRPRSKSPSSCTTSTSPGSSL